MRRAALVALWLTLASGCASALKWEPDSYTVQSGDTLYGIAWRYGVDFRDLAAWNDLGRGNLIHPGQKIVLKAPAGWHPASGGRAATATAPPASRQTAARSGTANASGRTGSGASRDRPGAPKAPPVAAPSVWVWPTDGAVKSAFGGGSMGGKGIDIAGAFGQSVKAAAAGEVVYSGSGLIGYGQLIIIKHNETFLSAYGHNSQLAVQEGDRVTAGEAIAQMGEGPGHQPVLHFEVRRDGKPVDPIRYLPNR